MAGKVEAAAVAKQRRQKKIAAVGGIILLALLAFQVPRTLKLVRGSEVAAAAAPAAAATAAGTAGVSAGGTVAPAPAAEHEPGAEAGAAMPLGAGGLLKGKDPFVQQVRDTVAPQSEASAGGPQGQSRPDSATAKTAAPKPLPKTGDRNGTPQLSPVPIGVPSVVGPGPSVSPVDDQPSATPTSALISVNGVREQVSLSGSFPEDAPIFRLVRITESGSVEIGIVGGSLTGGNETLTLERGKRLTLMNTADGTRYELLLVETS